jgi:threonine aldolase
VSKSRLISAQFLGLLEDGHWLDLARHANAMATALEKGLTAGGCRIPWPVETNEVFPILPDAVLGRLRAEGAAVYDWPPDALPVEERPQAGETFVRLVASFANAPAEVERFLRIANGE